MIDEAPLPVDFPARDRVLLTTSCRDAYALPCHPDAGVCGRDEHGSYQVMHNGLRVVRGGYHGDWMEEIIRRLRGVHEPQEEVVFHHALGRMPPGATMIELGGFWAWYSLWFRSAVADARNFVVEPDPANIGVGRANFARNGWSADFTQASVGATSEASVPFVCESDGATRGIPQIGLDAFLAERGIERVDLLHADIQGAETAMLEGARKSMAEGRIRLIFVSTHHHSISGDPLTHQRTLAVLREAGARILVEHSVAESFSGDGLVVASFDSQDAGLASIPISRARASDGIFPEVEYDLAEAWAQLRKVRERKRRRGLSRWLGRIGR
jgi:FkbM family methyltransferase